MYRTAADYYSEYRMPYPESVIRLLVEHFSLDGRGELLDVGCGTGQLTIPLSRYFESAMAIDISPEMIEAAGRSARAGGVSNISFIARSGDEIPKGWGPFNLVTYGSSLHWMDVPKTLGYARDLLVSGGGVAICGMRSIWGGDSDWERTVTEVVREFLGDERRAGDSTYSPPPTRFEDTLINAGFVDVVKVVRHPSFVVDIQFVIGHLYTTSYANVELLGDRRTKFEEKLTDELSLLNKTGRFTWEPSVNCLLAYKN